MSVAVVTSFEGAASSGLKLLAVRAFTPEPKTAKQRKTAFVNGVEEKKRMGEKPL